MDHPYFQGPSREHPTPAQSQPVASYKPAIPRESEMPDEWGYPPSSAHQASNISGYTPSVVHQTGPTPHGVPQPVPPPPTVPICRYPNCHRPVTWDTRTHEYAEYCGVEHMRDAMQFLGVAVCAACGKYPRRTNGQFCGSTCETWAVQRERKMQLSQDPRGQQEHQQWHQQHQHWQPPPSMGSQPNVININAGPVTWNNPARGSAPPNNGSLYSRQGPY